MNARGTPATRPGRDHLPPRPQAADPSGLVTLSAAYGLLLVVLFGRYVASLEAWNSKETTALHWLSPQSWTAMSDVAVLISSPAAAPVVLVGVGLLVAATRGLRRAVVSVLITATSWLGAWFVAIVVHRPEPVSDVAAAPADFAGVYPDGSTVLATSAVVALVTALGPAHRRWSVPAGVLLVAVTGAATLQRGTAYPSDLLAAVVFAVSSSTLVGAALATSPGIRLQTLCRLTALARSAPHQDKRPEGMP